MEKKCLKNAFRPQREKNESEYMIEKLEDTKDQASKTNCTLIRSTRKNREGGGWAASSKEIKGNFLVSNKNKALGIEESIECWAWWMK